MRRSPPAAIKDEAGRLIEWSDAKAHLLRYRETLAREICTGSSEGSLLAEQRARYRIITELIDNPTGWLLGPPSTNGKAE